MCLAGVNNSESVTDEGVFTRTNHAQVGRLNTGTIGALMVNNHAVGNIADAGPVRHSLGAPIGAAEKELSVAIPIFVARPDQAAILTTGERVESLSFRFGHSLHTGENNG
jgi:hypothetical protein